MKDYSGAIEDFTRAIELDPKSPLAYANRGMTHYQDRNADLALKDLEQAANIAKLQNNQKLHSRYSEIITKIKTSLINPSFKYAPEILPPETPQPETP